MITMYLCDMIRIKVIKYINTFHYFKIYRKRAKNEKEKYIKLNKISCRKK